MTCGDCGKKLENKVVLEIYCRYKDISRTNLINQMGTSDFVVGEGCNFDFDGKIKKNTFLMSKVVLEPGIEKHLYLRHFESTMERNRHACIALSISPKRENVLCITINNKLIDDEKYKPYISNIFIIDENGRKEYVDPKSDKEQHYKFENRYILFGQKDVGNTSMQVFGKFIRY